MSADKLRILLTLAALLLAAARSALQAEATKSVRLIFLSGSKPAIGNVGQVFARQVQQRCEAKVITTGDAPLTVELAIAPGIGAEGFRIEDRPGGGVRIVGNDERAALRRGQVPADQPLRSGRVHAGTWRGMSVPRLPGPRRLFRHALQQLLRGGADRRGRAVCRRPGPVGVNSLVLHFPHWQFKGFDDPPRGSRWTG